jgi:succinylarginine dihydrolase
VTVLTVPAQHWPEDAAAFLERLASAPQDAQLDVKLIRWGQRRATMQRRERWQARRARLAEEAARRANAGRDTLAALRSQKPIAAARPDAFPCIRFENPPDYGQIARGCHAYVDIVMKPI